MEQYTANSNSSTEQIVVQAGQIQQQVGKAVTGELALPAPSDEAVLVLLRVSQSSEMLRDAVRICVHLPFASRSESVI